MSENRIQQQLLTHADLKALGINLSQVHLMRLERARRFPKRIYLSPQRVCWDRDEIDAWLETLKRERL